MMCPAETPEGQVTIVIDISLSLSFVFFVFFLFFCLTLDMRLLCFTGLWIGQEPCLNGLYNSGISSKSHIGVSGGVEHREL